jgi:hypothetical protein
MVLNLSGSSKTSASGATEWFVPWRFAVLLGVLLIACFPQVVAGLETFAYLDFGQFACPVAFYHRECFWRGEIPLWNPLNDCGVPFLAQWNTLTLYPFSLIYLLLPFPWSLCMFDLLHLFLGGMGMYFLAHRWTGNRLAAAVAGAVFAFNGMTWYGLIWPHITVALGWMPWVVLTMDRAWIEGGRAVALAALAGAMQMLSGGAEVILLTWIVLGAFLTARVFGNDVPRLRLLGRALFASSLAVGLAAAQLLPFLDLLAHSQRTRGYADSAMAAMPLTGWANFFLPIFHCFRNAQGLFVPPNHWTASYYSGIAAVGLALLAVWRTRNSRVWLLMGLTVFAVLIAFGGPGLVYDRVTRLMPLLGMMRFPIKFVMLATFSIPLMAACGLAWVLALPAESRRREWNNAKGLTLALLALLAALAWIEWLHPAAQGAFAATAGNALERALFLALIFACIAALCRGVEPKLQPLLQIGLVMLLWFDVFTHNACLSPTIPPAILEPDAVRHFFRWDNQLEAGASRLMESRISYKKMLTAGFQNLGLDTSGRRLAQFFDFNLLDHTPKFDGFYSLDLKEFADVFKGVYYTTNEASKLQDFLGVSQTGSPANFGDWVRRDTFLPLVTAGQEPVFADDPQSLAALLSDSFDPSRAVYLPLDARGRIQARGSVKARVLSSRFSSRRLEIDVQADAPAMVVVAQTFYHPWRAYVDGKASPLWRANYAFQALEIPFGTHHVNLVYEDNAFFWGVVLSLASLLACALLWFWARPNAGRPAIHTP